MAVIEIIFAGLVAHFTVGGGNTAAVIKASGHSPFIAVTDPQPDTSFLKNCTPTGNVPPITYKCPLDGQHIEIVLPPGNPNHDASFDKSVPHLKDVTGGIKPMPEVLSGSTQSHLAALIDYSGDQGTLYADCYFQPEQELKLLGYTSSPFCPAQYTRFRLDTAASRITILN